MKLREPFLVLTINHLSSKAIPAKRNKSPDQYYTTFKDGKARACDDCNYKTSIFEDLYDYTKKESCRAKAQSPECDFAKSPIFRVKGHLYSQFFCDQCPFIRRSKDTTDSQIQFAQDGVVLKCDLCTECTVQTKNL